jgi:hypothetical protein|nr:MAG TPA_asm: hypothetical protein [Bacteriophage sp.]
MVLLIITSLLLLVAYMAYSLRVIKVIPWSVSDTYYQLEKRGRKKWLFQLAMIAPAMLLLPAWLECSSANIQFLAFLSCGGLVFVGAAPCFKLKPEGRIHYAATVICGVSSVLWSCLSGMWYIPTAAMLVAVGLGIKYQKWMFFLECAAFVSAYASILIA